MGNYRYSRNIEASLIDYLKEQFAIDWTGISVEKTFAKIHTLPLPSICIRLSTTVHEKAEIGDNATIRNPLILIDIFGTSDGNRLDLKDYIVEKIKAGCPYYDYVIANGATQSKTLNGRIRVLNIEDSPINFDIEKDKLDTHDRFRHLLELSITIGKVEA